MDLSLGAKAYWLCDRSLTSPRPNFLMFNTVIIMFTVDKGSGHLVPPVSQITHNVILKLMS